MKNILLAISVCSFFLLARPSIRAQEPGKLTAADSATIWGMTLDTLGKSYGVVASGDLLWVRGVELPQGRTASWAPFSDEVWDLFLRRFPNARRVDPVEYLYECPPGRVVRIPVSGCPIRGGGRIVWFIPLEKNEEGEVTTWVRVIRSADDGTWTGYVTLQVRFARVEASDWRIAAILRYGET